MRRSSKEALSTVLIKKKEKNIALVERDFFSASKEAFCWDENTVDFALIDLIISNLFCLIVAM